MRYFVLFAILFFLCFGCAKIIPQAPELRLNSRANPYIVLDEDIISAEPTIFVRSIGSVPGSSRELDELLERKLTALNHRLTNRSKGASIRISSQLVFLGLSTGVDLDKLFKTQLGEPIPKLSSEIDLVQYDYIVVVDLKVTTTADTGTRYHRSRVFAGILQPKPVMSESEIQTVLLDRTASQISMIFEF